MSVTLITSPRRLWNRFRGQVVGVFQFVDLSGVLVQDLVQGVPFEAEVYDSLGVGFRAWRSWPVGTEDHLPCQALEVEVAVVVGELFRGEAGNLDPHVLAHKGDEGGCVVPPAPSAVGEDD